MAKDVNTGVVKWVALIIIAITSSVITFMMSAVNVAVPQIGNGFQMAAVLPGRVVTAMWAVFRWRLSVTPRLAEHFLHQACR